MILVGVLSGVIGAIFGYNLKLIRALIFGTPVGIILMLFPAGILVIEFPLFLILGGICGSIFNRS